MPARLFHSSMRLAYSVLLFSLLAAAAEIVAAPQTGVTDKNAAEDGSILEAVEDETTVRLARILDADPHAWKARNGVKNQPLHLAAEAGNNAAVSLLLERGADATARGNGGWTPLHFAAEEGHPETCRILLKAGAKRGALCDFECKPMDFAQDPETRLALKSDRVLVPGVKGFLSAAGEGDLEAVQTMLKDTPNLLDARGSQGKTAVMEAAAHNHVELLKWLIGAGADINLMTEEKELTALYLATEGGHVETVKLLLDHEVEVNPAPTNQSEQSATESPLSLATTVMVISERGTRAASATTAGDSERENLQNIVQDDTDMDGGAGFRSMLKDAEEPLRSRRTEIAKLLIAAGAKPDIKGRGVPLLGASLGRQVEIVRLLLEAGADPDGWVG